MITRRTHLGHIEVYSLILKQVFKHKMIKLIRAVTQAKPEQDSNIRETGFGAKPGLCGCPEDKHRPR